MSAGLFTMLRVSSEVILYIVGFSLGAYFIFGPVVRVKNQNAGDYNAINGTLNVRIRKG